MSDERKKRINLSLICWTSVVARSTGWSEVLKCAAVGRSTKHAHLHYAKSHVANASHGSL